jgi:hypothetical protein
VDKTAIATIIVGLMGFGGVMDLRESARVAREQHHRAIAHERRTVRTVQLEESKFLKLSYEDRDKTIAQEEGSPAFVVPADTMTDATIALLTLGPPRQR